MKTMRGFGRKFLSASFAVLAPIAAVRGAPASVTTTSDTGAGSLRQAISATPAGGSIEFNIPTSQPGYNASTGVFTITLTSGELQIGRDLTITGPTNAKISINANSVFRVFNVLAGNVRISNVTITNGRAAGAAGAPAGNTTDGGAGGVGEGGGILNAGVLTLSNCSFFGDVALGGSGGTGKGTGGSLAGAGGAGRGGAIANSGSLALIGCTISNGFANGGHGGGPDADGVTNVTGGPGGTGFGGAIYNSGTLSLINSTVAEGSANGGIGGDGGYQGGNGGDGRGGAIMNAGSLSFVNSTVTNSQATGANGGTAGGTGGTGGSAAGGCLFQDNNAGSSKPRNVIIAAGSLSAGTGATSQGGTIAGVNGTTTGPDVAGTINSQGHNLIGRTDGSSGWNGTDLLGGTTAGTALDPLLGFLQDNGGPTDTRRPMTGSAAIDSGDDAVLNAPFSLTTDQRGYARKVGAHVDIGAVEIGTLQPGPSFTVTNTAMHDDGSCATDDCTFLEALNASNVNSDSNTIRFAPSVSGTISTIGFNSNTGLAIVNPLTINGPGARVLTVSGGLTARIFQITSANVVINGLAISDGFINQGRGGAITNSGGLTLQDCLISGSQVTGNDPVGFGGGIFSASGSTLTLNRCTVLSNSAFSYGGGVYTDGTFIATNCTFYNNRGLRGGGIIARAAAPTMTLHNCTVTGNAATDGVGTAGFGGGGVYAEGGTQQHLMANCIVSGNTSKNDPDVRGNYTSQGHNLIGAVDDAAGFGAKGDQLGVNPQFENFGDHGGPTDTWSLLSTSLAKNSGDNNFAPPTDQRGFPRVGVSDIGAFEFGSSLPTPTPTPSPSATPTPTPTSTPKPTPTPTPTPTPPSQLLNLSTRKQVGAGNNVLIGGFIVVGTENKKVLLRGLGPSLPVSGALADPTLELHRADTTLLAANNNWRDKQEAEIIATGIPPSKNLESAIVATLAAKPLSAGGAGYTGVLAGTGGTTGIGLLEIYDLNTAAKSKLANISTRGFVGTDPDLLIGGFIPGPSDRKPLKVLVRALGPSLAGQGVSGALQDPLLELHDGNGHLLVTNDNWQQASNASEIQATLPPPDKRESAIITTLAPSNAGYTAVVRGASGTTGVALVEVYALD